MKLRTLLPLLVGLPTLFLHADEELKAHGRMAFTEGPAWHPSGDGNVYFTDIQNDRIMRMDPAGEMHVYRTPSGKANGLLFDPEGRLHACEGGNRRITRTELDGTITVLTDRYEGKRYNSPNDLTMDSKGRVYFTDPGYGPRPYDEMFDEHGSTIEGVFRIDPDGTVERIITHTVQRPNGIAISSGDEYLFVADNSNSDLDGNRKLWRFQLNADGTPDVESQKLLYDWGTDRGPDGITIGPDGKRVYATAGFNFSTNENVTTGDHPAGVYVFDFEGNLERRIDVPIDMITNCTFGGEDGRTLFITAGHRLWSVRVDE